MSKKPQRAPSKDAGGQGGTQTIWTVVAAAFGGLLVLSFLAPADSISVFVGTALPQNLGWLLLAVLAAFASRSAFFQVRPSRTEIVVVGLGLSWLIAVTWLAAQHGNGRSVWNGFWQVMSLASCFYISRALFICSQVRAIVILLLLVGSTAMSFVGMEQVLISLPANRAQYAENPERMLADYGLDAPPGSPRRAQFEARLNSPEPFANFALANSLASLLCIGVILTGGVLANLILRTDGTPKDKSQTWLGLIGLSIALLIQLICLLLTRSRTAYLSILVAIGLWLVLAWMRGRVRLSGRALRISGVAFGVLALIGFGWLLTVDRLVWSEAPKSISYRLEYWQATLAMIRDHVWTGVGLGNFQAYYPQYKLEQASEIVADPHNWVLDIAATLSVPISLLAMGWIVVTVVKGIGASLADPMRTDDSRADSDSASAHDNELDTLRSRQLVRALVLGAGVGGCLAGAMLAFANSLDLPTNLVAWGLSAGLGWIVWRAGWAETNSVETSPANLVAAVVAIVTCLLSSGSWQASGIAIPLMVLLAMHWPLRALTGEPIGRWVAPTVPAGARWVAPIVAAAGFAIFVVQTWRPVTQSWMLAENAAVAPSNDERLGLFDLAVAADPLDTERAMHRVQLLAAKAIEVPDSTTFNVAASHVMGELKRLSPPNVVSFLVPKLAGEISLQLAASASRRGLPNQEYLAAAGGFYSLAVERYPSSVEMLVQLAAASALKEDWQSAKESLEKARQISDQTPHLDKKLAAQMILLPLKPAGFESQSDYVPAEPLADWLRTEIETRLR